MFLARYSAADHGHAARRRGRFGSLHLAALFAALVGTVLFSIPMLQMFKPGSAGWPAYLLSGDVRIQLFPQFVAGYFRFWHGSISGIDFATNGGASSFGFRPNMLQFYPPYIAAYLVADIGKPYVAAFMLSVLQLLHIAVGLYFTVRLGTRFLSLSRGSAVLLALIYLLSFTTGQYFTFFLYFFQICLMPVVAYCLCVLMLERRVSRAILVSPVFLTYTLTNYGPTMVVGLATAVGIAAFVFATRIGPRLPQRGWRQLILPAFSLGLALIVAAPFYIAEQRYHAIASTVAGDVETTAFSGSFGGTDILSAFSWLLPGAAQTEGSLHWGFIPPAVLLLGLLLLASYNVSQSRLRLMILGALGVFFCFTFVTFGRSTIGADLLYVGAPIIGSMHLYQRYLMFGQFFLWLAFALAAQLFVMRAPVRMRQACILLSAAAWIVASFAIGFHPDIPKVVNTGWLLVEGVLFLVGMLILSMGRGSVALAVLALPIVATSLWPVYGGTRSLGVAEFWKTHMGYSKAELDRLSDLLQANDGKQLAKVLDLTGEIDTYVGRNQPWLLFGRRPVMNFYGYEPHLSMETDYLAMMGGAYANFNRDWVLHTGVDTVIWTPASESVLKALTVDTVSVASTETVGPGVFVSRLRYDTVPRTGEPLPLLVLRENNPELWHPSPLNGWRMENGRAVRVPNGGWGTFSIPVAPIPGEAYGVSLDVQGSSKGSLTLSFGNTAYPEPIPGASPGTYTREYTAREPGGLWVNASPEFDGAVTNIVIRKLPRHAIPPMKVAADNGVLRLESLDGVAEMTGFKTNWTTTVSAGIRTAVAARLVYQLWPSRYMIPYLDGAATPWERGADGVGFLNIPPGEHRFELRFRSLLASTFALLVYAFLALVALAALYAVFGARLRRIPLRRFRIGGTAGLPSTRNP